MKKNRMFDTKGFMLVETLLVSLTISGILVYMYAQFSTINNTYQKLYSFNTANSLYRTAALREFMMNYTSKNGSLYSGLKAKTINCSSMPLAEKYNTTQYRNYCNSIVAAMDTKQIILTVDKFNEDTVIEQVSDSEEKAKLRKFLNTVKRYSTEKKRLIVIFNDGTMATVLFKF